MMDWQPIISAPTDWREDFLIWSVDVGMVVACRENGIIVIGWNHSPASDSFTHWQPLPPPPQQDTDR
jgi:hypothetical protein